MPQNRPRSILGDNPFVPWWAEQEGATAARWSPLLSFPRCPPEPHRGQAEACRGAECKGVVRAQPQRGEPRPRSTGANPERHDHERCGLSGTGMVT